jgi:hypothetical protein
MALRAKIRPDAAEPEGFGGSKVEGENKVWPNFHSSDQVLSPGTPGFCHNPKGRGRFSPFRCRLSLQ